MVALVGVVASEISSDPPYSGGTSQSAQLSPELIFFSSRIRIDFFFSSRFFFNSFFFSQVAFLTQWASPGDLVVYVGGGTGMHLPTLARMFPMVHFDVFDVKPLNALILGETAPR
jgi:hypothetical protein